MVCAAGACYYIEELWRTSFNRLFGSVSAKESQLNVVLHVASKITGWEVPVIAYI